MSRSLKARDLCSNNRVDRVVSLKELHRVREILMRRQPSVEAYGEMMSPDGRERVGVLIQFVEMCGGSYCGRHFLIGLTGAG